MKFILYLSLLTSLLFSYDFHFIKHESNTSSPTLLVIGGIHGNEPGGYFAANILANHYTITSGNVWIVPDLNQESIVHNKRGFHGDMNRKFASITKKDKDFNIIKDIKKIITNKDVSLVLNLHDGHGFYRKEYKSTIFNPNAWGQTCVIDQDNLSSSCPFGNLNTIASNVSKHLNSMLIENHHSFNVKNTKTKFDDEQMQLSLTYYAVRHNKPAFAIETSKDLSSLAQKVYYQLIAIEAFMNEMHINFVRDFKLEQNEIKKIVTQRGSLIINGNIELDLNNIRSYLSYIPIKSKNNDFYSENHLVNVKRSSVGYSVYVGNYRVTLLHPQYFSLCKIKSIPVDIDGVIKNIRVPSSFDYSNYFKVLGDDSIRVNVIGFKSKKHKNENKLKVTYNKIDRNRSIDKGKKLIRVELYKNRGFCGMLVAKKKD